MIEVTWLHYTLVRGRMGDAAWHKLTGGNIRNIALLAAFLAAEDGATIGMAHVGRAVRREYQKLGRLVVEARFEQ